MSFLSQLKQSHFWLAVLAEFLGTCLLVLFGCGSCNDNVPDPGVIAASFGLTVATIVWAIGHVSGGHINPAVTIAFLVTRKIAFLKAFFYILAQCLGAITGAVFLSFTYGRARINANLGTPRPAKGLEDFQSFLVEAAVTFLLVFVVFATCDHKRKGFHGSGPLAIGISITVGHLWAIPLTGAGTNPARVFGPAVATGLFSSHWIYWVGPIFGGILAALLYDFAFAENSSSKKLKAFFTFNYDPENFETEQPQRAHEVKEIKKKNEIEV